MTTTPWRGIGRNDQNQSNKLFNPNHKRCRPKGGDTQRPQYTPTHEKLRMQCTLIPSAKRKMPPKGRRECDQEITVAEI